MAYNSQDAHKQELDLPLPEQAHALPLTLAGMGRTEALAFVNRLFDAHEAGATLWDDAELIARFLNQCSPSNSDETRRAYARDLAELARWMELNHPGLSLRQFGPHHGEGFLDNLRRRRDAGLMAARTYNRRASSVSALFGWASEPQRSGLTGIARNPIPRRFLTAAPKSSRPCTEAQLAAIFDAVENEAGKGCRSARRDRVMLRALYLLGVRVSELRSLDWGDVRPVSGGGGIVTVRKGKGSKTRSIRISPDTLELIESLGRGGDDQPIFHSVRTGGRLTRQAIGGRCQKWGLAADVHFWPQRFRHTHATAAVERGVDIFTLQRSMGHECLSTTALYVGQNPMESSSTILG